MRDRFTASEWEALECLPLNIFMAVAGIDQDIDQKEQAALAKELSEAMLYKDPLAKEVLFAIASDIENKLKAFLTSSYAGPAGFDAAATALDGKLTPAEAKSFKETMVLFGKAIAEASGSGVFKRDPISDDEKAALGFIIQKLRL